MLRLHQVCVTVCLATGILALLMPFMPAIVLAGFAEPVTGGQLTFHLAIGTLSFGLAAIATKPAK